MNSEEMASASPYSTELFQVLWGSNRHVGCATQLCNGFYFTSYVSPCFRVNVVGASIYPIGAVCSACPTGSNNCDGAVGLCSY
ncbi:unnamed protein product [Angiostrongylus costaricensis]|uniref:SCP domain-containing protein n=1 Tax=Angiostrongylus costaricensis TaxID=334426 RepID=A0A0R3PSN9_ANGCS|nr:unnamed protein product [Angiostrongylus costaricensis]